MIPKFRAWVVSSLEMLKVNGIHFDDKELYCELDEHYEDLVLDFNEIILMQCTGLADINGAEIFEGDILKCMYDGDEESATICVVQWGGDSSYPAFDLNPPYNPDLMEKRS